MSGDEADGFPAAQEAQSDAPAGAKEGAYNPFPGFKSDVYAQDKMWMCKPGLANNYCTQGLDAIEALPNGEFKKFTETVGTTHPVDCVYWYPTVNRTEEPTSLDFSDPKPMLDPLRTQAARFSRICNVYAPFYRQTSLNRGGDGAIARKDVIDSFKHYLANYSQGRDFILLGHSQGSGHLTNLLKELFDKDPELRKRLIAALPIGSGVTVKKGDVVGGTFQNIPLCTSSDQTGCVITYRSFVAGSPPAQNGNASSTLQSACTSPAALNGKGKVFSGSFFYTLPTAFNRPDFGARFTEKYALFRDLWQGECVVDPKSGASYLAVSYHKEASDKRREYVNLSRYTGGMGLHVLDYHFAMDDLLSVVSKQIAAKAAKN